MTTVVSAINLINSNGFSHSEFEEILAVTELEYGDV